MTINGMSPEKTSSSAINVMIRRIKKAQETNNIRVQNCLLLIAEHTLTYNDCSGMARLMNALPAGLARNASVIIEVMAKYTPIMTDLKGGTFVCRLAKPGSNQHKPFDLDGLRANPWYTHEGAGRDPKVLDLDSIGDQLMKLADRILKKIDKGENAEGQAAELKVVANGLRVFAKSIPDHTVQKTEPEVEVEVEVEVEPEVEPEVDNVSPFAEALRVVNG